MTGVINFDNYQFYYRLTGHLDKPLVLLLHGFIGDSNDFNEVISLSSEQFSYLTIDLPGHGKTQIIGGEEYYTMPNTAQALINLLEQLGIKQCFLIGYSMGGRLALYLTLHFPQYFSKVVLESASPGLKTQQERLKRIQNDLQLADELETSDFSSFLSKWYSQPLFASLKKYQEFERLIERRLQSNPLELAKSLRNMSTGHQPPLWEKLKQNTNPILLLAGEYDRKFIKINSEMASLCELATVEIISDCGHTIHLENVKAFAESTSTFLNT